MDDCIILDGCKEAYRHAFMMPVEKARRLVKLPVFDRYRDKGLRGVITPLHSFCIGLYDNLCTFI